MGGACSTCRDERYGEYDVTKRPTRNGYERTYSLEDPPENTSKQPSWVKNSSSTTTPGQKKKSSSAPKKNKPKKLGNRFQMFEAAAQKEKKEREENSKKKKKNTKKWETTYDRQQREKAEREAAAKEARSSGSFQSSAPSTSYYTKRESDPQPDDVIESGSVSNAKNSYIHNLNEGRKEREQKRLEKFGNRQSLRRLEQHGTGRTSEQNEQAKKILGERVEKQKKGEIPSLYDLDEDDDEFVDDADEDDTQETQTGGDGAISRPTGPSGRRRRKKKGKNMLEIFEEKPEEAVTIVQKMDFFKPPENKKVIRGSVEEKENEERKEAATELEDLTVFSMMNDDRLSKLTDDKRETMENMIAKAIGDKSDLETVNMVNCGMTDGFIIKVLDSIMNNPESNVTELSFENRGNEFTSRAAIKLGEFLKVNNKIKVIKIAHARGTIGNDGIEAIIEGWEENESLEKFSFDRGRQIRLQQHLDKIDRLMRRNQDLRRKRAREAKMAASGS